MGILGSIGSFLFGGSKKGTSSKSSGTTTIAPYAPVVPYLPGYLDSVNNLYNGGAPAFSDTEQQGYDALKGVTSASPGLDSAVAENQKTTSGQYLTPETNPYLADIARRMGDAAGSTAAAQFSGRGRTGSGLAGYYTGKGVADAVGSVYGANYEAERGRMGQAVGQAPSLDMARYNAPQALISAGQNISARPFDLASQQGGILAKIGAMGQQGTTTGQVQNYVPTNGLIGDIFNSFTNKLFGTTRSTG